MLAKETKPMFDHDIHVECLLFILIQIKIFCLNAPARIFLRRIQNGIYPKPNELSGAPGSIFLIWLVSGKCDNPAGNKIDPIEQ